MIKMNPQVDPTVSKIFKQIGVPVASEFKPDKFQLDAVSAIKHSDCLVMAPTGSGKTWIAEESIRHFLKLGHKIWYGTPLKALTNTIYAGFKKKFGEENVGILTGDRKENRDAPLVIGTTEILRNQLYDSMHKGTDLKTDFVILDEAHFLGDEDRGVVWEEIMIYLPPRIPLLMLSATIGNGVQIASWLHSIRGKECVIINEETRPVPLHPLFLNPLGTLYPLIAESKKTNKTMLHKKVVEHITKKDSPQLSQMRGMPPIGEIMKVLHRFNLLPAIFFLKSRADCDKAVELCNSEILTKDLDRKAKLNERIAELVKKSPHMSKHKQLWILENLAVGSHHSGQLPIWKIIIETLMSEGLLDAIFATSTVAAGVNFPARTVVIFNSDRFNGIEFAPLDSSQLRQMTGRAGRRGMDNIGFAVNIPGKFLDVRMIAKLINAPSTNVNSQININFSMVLNLLLSHKPEQIKKLLDNSFAAFQLAHDKKKRWYKNRDDNREYLWNDFLYHLDFLQIEGYVDNIGNLTEEGEWTSKLRIDSPLLVAESLKMNLIPKDDPALLAAIIASFVNEREFDDDKIDKKQVQKKLLTSFIRIKSQLKPFATDMFRKGFEVKPLFLKPAITIYSWATSTDWERTVKQSGLAEGDLARLIMRTAENLRHFKSLKDNFPEVTEAALTAVDLLMKEPVISYYE